MANSNRFFPIFPDGEDPTPSESHARSKKPAAKRSRQETPSPPLAPAARAARAHTPAPLAIEAPPLRDDSAITNRLDEIELTMRKYLIRIDAMESLLQVMEAHNGDIDISLARLGTATSAMRKEVKVSTSVHAEAIAALTKKVDGLLTRPAPVAASDPQMVAAIAALSMKVDGLLERSTAAPAATVVASAPEQTAAIAALSKKVDGLLERPVIAPAPESQNLAALTKQVTAVSQQLTSLTARHSTTAAAPTKKPAPPAATTAKPARAATAAKAAPAPTKPAENVDSAWNPVVSKKTKRRQQAYPPAERRIVVQLAEAPNDAQKAADTALRTVNRALVGHPDVTVPPLYTAYVSRTNALVFTAGPRHRGRDYEPFLGIIRNALAEIPTVSAHVSQLWSRYVINGIPTTTTPDDAREEIEWLYPAAKLAKAPRWLTTAENRREKAASSMVITLVGRTKLSQMLLFNRECDVREYIPFRDTTQCSRCQRFGHPAALCKATPACAVCAQPHLTHQHPCDIPGCPKGRRCAHPPLCCALCQQPHKATDRLCPAFLALARSEDQQQPEPSDAPCPTPEEDTAMNEQ
jgi:hypothetical protein